MITEDRTFSDVSLYGSIEWTAAALGVTKDVFFRKRAKWEKQAGFPTPDPINRCYIKADVIAWVNRRRRIADVGENRGKLGDTETQKVRTDVL